MVGANEFVLQLPHLTVNYFLGDNTLRLTYNNRSGVRPCGLCVLGSPAPAAPASVTGTPSLDGCTTQPDPPPVNDTCATTVQQATAAMFCDVLVDAAGVYGACYAAMPTRARQLYALCRAGACTAGVFCDVIKLYEEECMARGVVADAVVTPVVVAPMVLPQLPKENEP